MTNISKQNLLRSTMLGVAIAFGGVAPTMIATTAHAQDYTSGAMEGKVYTSTGDLSSGTSVTLVSVDRGFTRTAISSDNGSFRFTRLPIGTYTVGVAGQAPETIKVRVGQTSSPVLVVGGSIDEIIATGTVTKSQAFDFEVATQGLVVDVDETFAVTPLPRNLAAITQLTPGTSAGDTAFGNLSSLGGSSVAENVFYVNGMNTTDFRNGLGGGTVPFEFYDQIQTKIGGLPAEFGRTTGGVSNAVTKSGTNDWHFGASVYHENADLRASAKNILSDRDNDPSTPSDITSANIDEIRESTEYNFWVSGPIIKDRLLAYALYSPRNSRSTSNSALNGESNIIERDNPFYGGKLDVILSDNHLVEFTGFHNFSESVTTERDATFDEDGRLLTATENGGVGSDQSGGDTWSAKYTGNLTDWFTISALYGEQTEAQTIQSSADDLPAIVDVRQVRPNGTFPGGWVNFTRLAGNDKRKLFRADADIYVDDLFGEHHFRVGFDREELTANSQRSNSGGIYYRYDSVAACDNHRTAFAGLAATGEECLRIREFNSGGEFETIQTAFYAQDAWDVTDQLTLNLGLRLETFDNRNADGETFIEISDQLAPRLSFAYRPDFDASGSFFGSYGKYYLPVATNTNIRLAGAETFIHRYYEWDGTVNEGAGPDQFTPIFDEADIIGPDRVFGDGTTPSTASVVDQNISAQNMDEFVIGYSTDLSDKFDGELGNWSVGAAFTYNKLNDALEDATIDQAVNAYCVANNIAGCEDTFGGAHQFVLLNPGSDITVEVPDIPGQDPQVITFSAADLQFPEATRTYKGLELKFDRVAEDSPWGLHGSWTISESEGNYEGSVKSDNGQTDAGLTTDFDFPALTENADGFLPNHRAHKAKLWGNYRLTEQANVGFNATAQSGRKFGCLGEYAGTGTEPQFGDSWYCDGVATPRGSEFTGNWTATIDLNASYTVDEFPLGEVVLRADIFNVLNTQKGTDFDEFGDTFSNSVRDNNFGRAIGYQAPRRVRFGLDWRY